MKNKIGFVLQLLGVALLGVIIALTVFLSLGQTDIDINPQKWELVSATNLLLRLISDYFSNLSSIDSLLWILCSLVVFLAGLLTLVFLLDTDRAMIKSIYDIMTAQTPRKPSKKAKKRSSPQATQDRPPRPNRTATN